jgi:hypothetical protein
MRNGRHISVANDNAPFPDGSTVSVSKSRPFDSKYFQADLIKEDVSSLLPGQMAWQPGRTRYEINAPRKNNRDGGNGTDGPTVFSKIKRFLAFIIASAFILSFAGLIFGLGFSNSMSVLTLAGFAAVMTLTGFIAICFISLICLCHSTRAGEDCHSKRDYGLSNRIYKQDKNAPHRSGPLPFGAWIFIFTHGYRIKGLYP